MYLQSVKCHLVAWVDLTDTSLFHQLAQDVAVGHPGGHSSATGLGAGGPSCGLEHTLDSSSQQWVKPKSCTRNKIRLTKV